MASKPRSIRDCSQENSLVVRRFIYDVLVYTLKKSGLAETSLPTTDLPAATYPQADIVKIAGVSVLRSSLIMRDKWKRMFTSRLKSRGFTDEDVLDFLARLVICCPQSRLNNTQSMIQLYLASSNEIMMFFDLKKVDIDFSLLTHAISLYIYGMMVMNEDGCETFESLFDSYDDLSEYIEWITDFIAESALPYGSRDDVSDLFFQHVRKRFQDRVEKLVQSHEFLPHDLYAVLTLGESGDLAQPTPKDGELPGALNLPTSSEACALGWAFKRSSSQPGNVVEHSGQSSKVSSELGIEQDLEKMCVGAEGTSKKPHGAIPKHKTTKNKDASSCPFLAKFGKS